MRFIVIRFCHLNNYRDNFSETFTFFLMRKFIPCSQLPIVLKQKNNAGECGRIFNPQTIVLSLELSYMDFT